MKSGRPQGRGVPSCGSQINGNRNKGDDVYPSSDPLDGGKTLRHALVYIDGDVSKTELIYREIVSCLLPLGLGECNCDSDPSTG